jgi:hypothetical protein
MSMVMYRESLMITEGGRQLGALGLGRAAKLLKVKQSRVQEWIEGASAPSRKRRRILVDILQIPYDAWDTEARTDVPAPLTSVLNRKGDLTPHGHALQVIREVREILDLPNIALELRDSLYKRMAPFLRVARQGEMDAFRTKDAILGEHPDWKRFNKAIAEWHAANLPPELRDSYKEMLARLHKESV